MSKNDFIFILKSFVVWRIGIFLISVFAVNFVPLFSPNYLGGGYSGYIVSPLFWGHLNFDGEHFLAIAQDGYLPLQYFFFPLFPKLVSVLTMSRTQMNFAWVGIIISNISFFVSLLGTYKLVSLDYKQKVAKLTILLFYFFPTSFYFGAYYSESIFLMLVIWSFYFVRRNNFLYGGVISALASATRVVGGVLFPSMVIEMIVQKKFQFKNLLGVLIAPLGVLIYMYYLLKKTGDPLIFLHQVAIFGEQRSSKLILLPQVLYRYIFLILPHVSYSYFPNVFTTYLEFICGILVLILVIFGFFKLRLSYAFYALLAYIIPTLAGSFSSMPRYTLVVFPVFVLSAIYLNKLPKIYTYIIFSVMLLLLVISESLFWRGYWLS